MFISRLEMILKIRSIMNKWMFNDPLTQKAVSDKGMKNINIILTVK